MGIGILGIGFVGGAMRESFMKHNINVVCYDKHKPQYNTFEDCLSADILFLCLPTPYSSKKQEYDKQVIESVCQELYTNNYTGSVVLKSTVEPGTITILANKFNTLNIIHNPEFLTARTAFEDYHNQKHIVLGKEETCTKKHLDRVVGFYTKYYPDAELSICTSLQSECMKSFTNCFYAVKVQFFTELYLLCDKTGCDYDTVKDIMLKNDWINPMHTNIPGPDGEISYGGLCFPKDTNALLKYMKLNGVPHKVLQSVIEERDTMRKDSDNCT
jgi:UDPglucose 6-dehydrogenase